MRDLRLTVLALAWLHLAGCTLPGAILLAGDVVNAAGKAALDRQEAEMRRPIDPAASREQMIMELLGEKARNGDRDAQYQLGLYYAATRNRDAQVWICQAANRHHPKAQLQMGHWYSKDRAQHDLWPYVSLRPDNERAYVWYSLAEQNGESIAGFFRDEFTAKAMTPDDISSAQSRLQAWEPASCGSSPFTAAEQN
jgi:TPR repeat protein